jgi:hypothetical protein
MDATNMNATAKVKATTVFFIMLPLSKETKIPSAFFSSSNPPKTSFARIRVNPIQIRIC